jgi:hypothetical protein
MPNTLNPEAALAGLASLYKLPVPLIERAIVQCKMDYRDRAAETDSDLLEAATGVVDWRRNRWRRPYSTRALFQRHLGRMQNDYYEHWVKPLGGGLAQFEVEGIGQRFITGSLSYHSSFKLEARLPVWWQVATENYRPGDTLSVYVREINQVAGWPGVEVLVSRNCASLVRVLLTEIVPNFEARYLVESINRKPGRVSQVYLSERYAASPGNHHHHHMGGKPAAIDQGYLDEISQTLWGEKVEVIYL